MKVTIRRASDLSTQKPEYREVENIDELLDIMRVADREIILSIDDLEDGIDLDIMIYDIWVEQERGGGMSKKDEWIVKKGCMVIGCVWKHYAKGYAKLIRPWNELAPDQYLDEYGVYVE